MRNKHPYRPKEIEARKCGTTVPEHRGSVTKHYGNVCNASLKMGIWTDDALRGSVRGKGSGGSGTVLTVDTEQAVSNPDADSRVQSGRVTTRGKQRFQYGYVFLTEHIGVK